MTQHRLRAGGGLMALGVALTLGGCGATEGWGPSWSISSRPEIPADGLTIQRVTGAAPAVAPLQREEGYVERMRPVETPRATLANPDEALQNIPEYRPVERPDLDRQTTPPREEAPRRRIRGSSTAPDLLPRIPEADLRPAPPPRMEALPSPPAARPDGRVVPIPGEAPGITTGGTDRYQTYNQPGTAGGGIAFPDGATTTVIGPDGRVQVVPRPR